MIRVIRVQKILDETRRDNRANNKSLLQGV